MRGEPFDGGGAVVVALLVCVQVRSRRPTIATVRMEYTNPQNTTL
ncbi:hypothetical protein [Roseimaritima multifibrata]|nr:hypothetical protein [Roseimaritima multifibrata]